MIYSLTFDASWICFSFSIIVFFFTIVILRNCLETLTNFTFFSSWGDLTHAPALKLLNLSGIETLKFPWKLLTSFASNKRSHFSQSQTFAILMEAVLFLVLYTKSNPPPTSKNDFFLAKNRPSCSVQIYSGKYRFEDCLQSVWMSLVA